MESQSKAKKLTDELNDATKKRTQILTDLERAQLALKKAQSEESIEIQRLRVETQELNKANKDTAKETLGLVSSYQKFAKEVNEAKKNAKNLASEMIELEKRFKSGQISKREYNREINRLSKEFVEAKAKALGLDQQLKKIDSSVGDNQRNVGNYKNALNGLTVSFRNLIAAFGVYSAVDIFADLARSSFETIKKLDAQNVALKQIFETETQVGFQKEYLADITNRYGLEIVSTTDAYTKYTAALRGTLLEGEKGRAVFESFSGASAKLGLNAEQQTGIFRALEQMISKGTVQAEELRGQLGDRMPGAFKLFADAAGVSTRELGDMLKEGKVLSADILPKVAEKLDEVYNLEKTTKVDTLVAAQNRFKNSWTSFLDETAGNKEIINGLAVGMEGLGFVMNFLLDTLITKGADGTSVIGDLVDIITSLLEAVGDIAEGLGIVDEKTKNNLFSLRQFKNDLKAISSVISVVSSAIKYLIETVTNFFSTMFQTDGWDKFINKMEASADKLLSAIGTYNKVQDGIKDANKKDIVYNGEANPYTEAWMKAKKARQDYFQVDGKYFVTATGKNTGKSVDDYIDRRIEGGTILERKEKANPDDFSDDDAKKKKAKAKRGSRLSGEQRDYLMGLQALRDLELAINERKYTIGERDERKYLQEIERINVEFYDKKIAYLKGRNAKERLEEARAQLDRAKIIKETQKKIFDLDYKVNEESHKIKMEAFEKESEELENNDYLSNVDRLNKQIDVDNQMIAQSSAYWQTQIDLAKAANQETLSIERKRDEEINKLQENRIQRVLSESEKFSKDMQNRADYLQALKGITFEEQKRKVLSDKRLSSADREYLLSILEKENQIEINKLEIDRLKSEKERLDAKVKNSPLGKNILTPEEAIKLAQLTETIEALENANIEIQIDINEIVFTKIAMIRDIFSNGFRNLGLENFANEFESRFQKMFQNLKDGVSDWKDFTALGVSLVADLTSNYVEQSTKQQIAALDEQLARTQETTDQELEFIDGRLARLNALDTLTKEQTEERNALEDEARVLKEQQFQREKMIEAQKARAMQKANAQQTMIAGIQGAVMAYLSQLIPGDPTSPIRGAIAAAATLAFAGVNAALIMSKNPVPEYFVGRKSGKAETAWTQEKGREIITSRSGKIKSLGSDSGPMLTKLAEGDKVFTATESMKILKSMPEINVGAHIHKIDNSRLAPLVIQKDNIDYDKLADKIGDRYERVARKYDKTTTFENDKGEIFLQEGGKIPVYIGRKRTSPIIIKPSRNERN